MVPLLNSIFGKRGLVAVFHARRYMPIYRGSLGWVVSGRVRDWGCIEVLRPGEGRCFGVVRRHDQWMSTRLFPAKYVVPAQFDLVRITYVGRYHFLRR